MSTFQNPRNISLAVSVHKRTESQDKGSPIQIENDVQKDVQVQKELGGQLHKFH